MGKTLKCDSEKMMTERKVLKKITIVAKWWKWKAAKIQESLIREFGEKGAGLKGMGWHKKNKIRPI